MKNDLNFRAKAWQCKLWIIKQSIDRIDFMDQEK